MSRPKPAEVSDGASGDPSVRVYRPALTLQSYVTFYYVVESPGPLTDFLYPEWGNIRFALAGEWAVRMPGRYREGPQHAVIYGPTDRCGEIVTRGGKIIGFGLTPTGWQRLVGDDASTMANRVADLGGQLGLPPGELHRALISDGDDALSVNRLEILLQRRLAERASVDPMIVRTDLALRNRPATVEQLARDLGVSRRTLHRLCLRGFGFPPKRLLRRERFLETLGHVRIAVGGGLNASLGSAYFDTAHFHRDFKDFMGMTPRDYFRASRPLMMEAAAAQIRAGVTLSFALPPLPPPSRAE